MKKRIVLSILLTSLVVLGGGALNRESLQNDEGTLAIYVEDEKVENIPSKGNSENYVFDHAVCTVSGEVTDKVEITWDDEAWAPVIKNLKDHNTKCNLYFVEGEEEGIFNSTLLACNESSNAAQCFLDNASLNPEELVYDETNENNLRYIGADPNNYVTFNNELWRIIGVMRKIPDSSWEDGNVLKIIRDASYSSSISWDTNSTGNWSTSTLKTELNDRYLQTIQSPFKEMIRNSAWNIGNVAYSGLQSYDAKALYSSERGTTALVQPSMWTGSVGLLYMSDYVFATGGINNTDRYSCLDDLWWSSTPDCHSNNWLQFAQNNWTLTLNSYASSYSAYYLTNTEDIGENKSVYEYAIATPVLYLDENVKFVSGSGTREDPYILDL